MPAADDEVERGGAPHAIGDAHLRQGLESKPPGEICAARCCRSIASSTGSFGSDCSTSTDPEVIGLMPIPNQPASADVWTHQPSGVSRIVPGAIGSLLRAITHPHRRIVDGDPVAFLECPAAGLFRAKVDAHRHVERGQKVA